MSIDEVLDSLSKLRAEHGNLPVLVHDGLDPSDLREVAWVEHTVKEYWWGPHGGGKVPCVKLTT